MKPASLAGIITVVMTLVGWSSVPLFLKYFADYIDAWTSNGWRYAVSALIWAPVLILGLRSSSLPAGLWRAAVVPSLVNCVGQVCFAWAHYKIDPGLLTFGLRFQIVFVAIGAYLLFPSERAVLRSYSYIAGLIMVFGGTVGTVLLGHELPAGTTAFGVTLAILSGASFAGYAISVRHYMHGTHPVTAFAAISLYTAMGMVLLMVLLGEDAGGRALALTAPQFAMLMLSAVVGIALGHVFYYISIARLGVAVSSGVIQLQPFVVAAASFFFFAERLTPMQWLSGAVAVTGAVLMLGVQRRIEKRRAKLQKAAQADDATTGEEPGPSTEQATAQEEDGDPAMIPRQGDVGGGAFIPRPDSPEHRDH